jgi:hypothetical protein
MSTTTTTSNTQKRRLSGAVRCCVKSFLPMTTPKKTKRAKNTSRRRSRRRSPESSSLRGGLKNRSSVRSRASHMPHWFRLRRRQAPCLCHLTRKTTTPTTIAAVEPRRDKVTTGGSTDDDSGGSAAFAATNGSSRTREFPAEPSLRILTSTTQQSNDQAGCCNSFCAHGTSPDRNIRGVVARRLRRATGLSRSSPSFFAPAGGIVVARRTDLVAFKRDTENEATLAFARAGVRVHDDRTTPIKARAVASLRATNRTANE